MSNFASCLSFPFSIWVHRELLAKQNGSATSQLVEIIGVTFNMMTTVKFWKLQVDNVCYTPK